MVGRAKDRAIIERHTTMKIATMMATPSIQLMRGLPGIRPGPKSWKKPRANEVVTVMEGVVERK